MYAPRQFRRIAAAFAAFALAATAAWAGPLPEALAPERPLRNAVIFLVVLLIWLLLKSATVALALAGGAAMPALTRAGRGYLTVSPIKCFFVGLVNFLFVLLLGVVILGAKDASSLLCLLLFLAWLLFLSPRGTRRRLQRRWVFWVAAVVVLLILIASVGEPVNSPAKKALRGVIFGPLGLLVLTTLFLASLYSRAFVHQLLGARLTGEPLDVEGPPNVSAQLRGGATFELATLVPIAGAVVAGIVTLAAFGALILAVMSRRQRGAVEPAASPIEEK